MMWLDGVLMALKATNGAARFINYGTVRGVLVGGV
jgi:hypothetical protein